MQHHQAPPPAEGVSPFTTPGTRLTWSSGEEWLVCLHVILGRHCSSERYAQIAAHLDELASHPDFIAAQPIEDLEGIRAAVVTNPLRPPQGRRAGTSYERVLNEANNALAAQRRTLIAAADTDMVGREVRL